MRTVLNFIEDVLMTHSCWFFGCQDFTVKIDYYYSWNRYTFWQPDKQHLTTNLRSLVSTIWTQSVRTVYFVSLSKHREFSLHIFCNSSTPTVKRHKVDVNSCWYYFGLSNYVSLTAPRDFKSRRSTPSFFCDFVLRVGPARWRRVTKPPAILSGTRKM